jgi:hypothetical protein
MASDLASTIRQKIRSGVLPLPSEVPRTYFVGKGTYRPCDACDEIITREQIEYELDIQNRTLRFHDPCLAAWHAARGERLG